MNKYFLLLSLIKVCLLCNLRAEVDWKPVAQSGQQPATQEQIQAADAQLNQIYQQLRGSMNDAQKQQLKLAQRDWLKKRDAFVAANPGNPLGALYEFTMQRVEELKKGLTQGSNSVSSTVRPPNNVQITEQAQPSKSDNQIESKDLNKNPIESDELKKNSISELLFLTYNLYYDRAKKESSQDLEVLEHISNRSDGEKRTIQNNIKYKQKEWEKFLSTSKIKVQNLAMLIQKLYPLINNEEKENLLNKSKQWAFVDRADIPSMSNSSLSGPETFSFHLDQRINQIASLLKQKEDLISLDKVAASMKAFNIGVTTKDEVLSSLGSPLAENIKKYQDGESITYLFQPQGFAVKAIIILNSLATVKSLSVIKTSEGRGTEELFHKE